MNFQRIGNTICSQLSKMKMLKKIVDERMFRLQNYVQRILNV